jgi:hypothetical protein
MTTQRVRVPKDLGPTGRKVYRSIVAEFELSATEEVELHGLARCADRLDAIAAALVDATLTVTNSRGDQVANPLLREARGQAATYSRILASLRIPQGEQDSGRPQRRGGARAPYGVRSVS